jgi:hypothetical protein
MMTPQARTKKLYEGMGYHVGIVERWIGPAKKRIDLFGMFDLIAFQGNLVVGIQATSGDHVSERVRKVLENPLLAEWCESKDRCATVVGWSKQGARGKRKTWDSRIVLVSPGFIAPAVRISDRAGRSAAGA